MNGEKVRVCWRSGGNKEGSGQVPMYWTGSSSGKQPPARSAGCLNRDRRLRAIIFESTELRVETDKSPKGLARRKGVAIMLEEGPATRQCNA